MLTDAKLRKLKGKPCEKRYELSDAAGLSVRITPAGMIVFQFRYRQRDDVLPGSFMD